ncbi:tRNA(His) guanylyltransferase 1-like protein isoform X1 [Tanacetum coccineum]|uniref:tRNA(His) guanylyltransferase n=1 Tax=Tanacetum coccineum TaxID=301880 RepID=A0ABQ4WW40_9ASTR
MMKLTLQQIVIGHCVVVHVIISDEMDRILSSQGHEIKCFIRRRSLMLKASTDIQAYLAYKQEECDEKNLKNTCFWKLVESGKSEQEAHEILEESEKGKGKQAKTEIRFQQFGINYKNLPDIFCQGSCILRTEIEDEDKRKVITVQAKKIASKNFLNGYPCLSENLTDLKQNASSIGEKHLNKWRVEHQMKQDRWIVIRIDGCSFSRFTEVHEFEKPTDEQALTLMNSCAMAVLEEFKEIVYGYGASDEYSFVLEKNTELHQRRHSKLVSAICSLFTDAYVSKWKAFFPKKELQYAPRFDGRAVCYKSYKLIRDYLSWRQVDCHVNNRHNTCFWALVKSGKSKREAQTRLQGTSTKEKYQMLSQEFGIDYNQLLLKFLNGSSVFWDNKEVNGVKKKLVVEYPNIIKDDFWHEHPHIIKNTDSMFTTLEYILFFTAPLTLCLLTRLF